MNMLILAKRVLLAASIVAWPLACGGSDENTGSSTSGACIEGATESCECEPGVTGARTCDGTTGAFGDCQCSLCGNDIIDTGEQCDGANLNGETCSSGTMMARPQGTVTCSACTLVVSGCTAPVVVSTGGTSGAGGVGGTGATMGAGATMGGGGLMGGGGTTF